VSVEMDAASKAGHVFEPDRGIQLCASVTGNTANRPRTRALPRAGLCEGLLISWHVTRLCVMPFLVMATVPSS
jgi:hypothetical protein